MLAVFGRNDAARSGRLDAPPFIAQTMLGLSRSNQSYGTFMEICPLLKGGRWGRPQKAATNAAALKHRRWRC